MLVIVLKIVKFTFYQNWISRFIILFVFSLGNVQNHHHQALKSTRNFILVIRNFKIIIIRILNYSYSIVLVINFGAIILVILLSTLAFKPLVIKEALPLNLLTLRWQEFIKNSKNFNYQNQVANNSYSRYRIFNFPYHSASFKFTILILSLLFIARTLIIRFTL